VSEIRRLHKCHDGVWRHAQNAAQGVSLRVTKLDAEGRPTGDLQEIGTAACVHFEYAEE